MRAVTLGVRAEQVTERIGSRLLGLGHDDRQVVWRRGPQTVLLRRDLIQTRFLPGWLVVSVVLQTDETGRVPLELVYFLGTDRDGDGDGAAVKINAGTPDATALAEIWGADLQRIGWDAVLDTIQGALAGLARRRPDEQLTIRGFRVGPEGLQVDVVVGEI